MLELDRFAKPLVSCPLLLDAASYFPDTVDLTLDAEARSYWLQCFEDATEKVSTITRNRDSHLLYHFWDDLADNGLSYSNYRLCCLSSQHVL